MKKVLAFLIFAGLCSVTFLSQPVSSNDGKKGAGAEGAKLRKNANKIENSYIVVLDDTVVGEKGIFSIAPYIASELATSHRGKIKHVYQHALNGFAVEMSAEDAERLSQDFRVKFVEEDGTVTAIALSDLDGDGTLDLAVFEGVSSGLLDDEDLEFLRVEDFEVVDHGPMVSYPYRCAR